MKVDSLKKLDISFNVLMAVAGLAASIQLIGGGCFRV